MLQFSNSFQGLLVSQQRDCPRRQLSASQTEIHLLTARWVSFHPECCSVTSLLSLSLDSSVSASVLSLALDSPFELPGGRDGLFTLGSSKPPSSTKKLLHAKLKAKNDNLQSSNSQKRTSRDKPAPVQDRLWREVMQKPRHDVLQLTPLLSQNSRDN